MPRIPAAAETPGVRRAPLRSALPPARTGSALRSRSVAPGAAAWALVLCSGRGTRSGSVATKPKFAASLGSPLSGVARPGLSSALPASLPASLHWGRAVAGAVLPSCEESESPFPAARQRPAAAGRDTGIGAVSPAPLLIPLLLPLPPRAAAGPGRERLRWLLLLSPCPSLSDCCPAPGAAAGGARAQPGALADRAAPRGRAGIPAPSPGKGSPRSSARCLFPLLAFPSLGHFCGCR